MPRHLFHVEKFIETKFVYLDIHLARLFLVLSYTVYFDIPLLSVVTSKKIRTSIFTKFDILHMKFSEFYL